MIQSFDFLQKVIDSLSEHIVVIDDRGTIKFTNAAWKKFGQENGSAVTGDWTGINYLSVCDKAAKTGDDFGRKASEGIRNLFLGGMESFHLEYPCHSPNELRWFMMSATRFEHSESCYAVVSHKNITERRLAEEYALNLSQVDGLTGVFNRRCFDEFLNEEWKRCARLKLPITLAMVDIDHFKLLNDAYGHMYGDMCLIEISNVLRKSATRPGDICARYGGEEFVIVFGNSSVQALLSKLNNMMDTIRNLKLPNKNSPTAEIVTVSVGVTTMYPSRNVAAETLIQKADELLYLAKEKGRNRIEYA